MIARPVWLGMTSADQSRMELMLRRVESGAWRTGEHWGALGRTGRQRRQKQRNVCDWSSSEVERGQCVGRKCRAQ